MSVLEHSGVFYPSSDGKRMADNTLQFRWIVTIEGGLEAMHQDDRNVFVAGDLLWYPVEGMPEICTAPDAMVVFGRPKGDRSSYKQWEENNIAPQVVFEILSPSNDYLEMRTKQDFYEDHGVEEYYEYDPYKKKLFGWHRDGSILRKIKWMHGWVSPLLKIRFEMHEDLQIFRPDGQPFLTFAEMIRKEEQQRLRADAEQKRAELAELKNQQLLELLRQKGIDPTMG